MQDTNGGGDLHQQLLRYGLDIGFILSGFFGALLLSMKNKKKSIGKSVSAILAGTACANYLTPLILNFAPDSIHEKGKYAVAFMMGYIGLKGLETLIDAFSESVKSKMNTQSNNNEESSRR
jgi:hypothetical protein